MAKGQAHVLESLIRRSPHQLLQVMDELRNKGDRDCFRIDQSSSPAVRVLLESAQVRPSLQRWTWGHCLCVSVVDRFTHANSGRTMIFNRVRLKEYFAKGLNWGDCYHAQIVFEFLCRAAQAAEGGVVLDAGAGHQRYKPFFCDALYIAQEHPVAGAVNKGIRVYDILCDVKHIPLMADSVQVVLSTSSLEHMRDPELFFKEANRVLVPGGSLWIHVPFAYDEHEIPFDFQRPTRYGLVRWYEGAGFERINVVPASSSVYAAIYLMEHSVDEEVMRICGGRNGSFEAHEIRALTKKFCAMLRVLDRGPFANTSLPIGWVSVGYKKGTRNSIVQRWESAEAFLRSRALVSPGVRFHGSQLISEGR